MQATYTAIPRQTLQLTRSWPDHDWEGAVDALASRGLVGGDGTPTDAGRAYLEAIEARTDELATRPIIEMGVEAARALAEAALPVAEAVMASGVVPAITPMFADDEL
jgi:hypothetical protein